MHEALRIRPRHKSTPATTNPLLDSSRSNPLERRDSDHQAINRSRLQLASENVKATLESLGYPVLGSVSCAVGQEGLVLSGAVPSYYLKQMAQVAALRVAGSVRVVNRLIVTSF